MSVARNKDHVLKVFAERTPGPQRKELMEISSTMQMQVLLHVTPRRLADETGGTRFKLLGPGPVFCACFCVSR